MERPALLVLGAWIGLLVASSAVATVNFRAVDRLLGAEMRPELDFVPRPLPPDLARRFGLLHGAYVIGDLVKLGLLAALAALLLRRPGE